MRRRIRKAEVKFLSLCPKGKNKMQVLYKADDGTVEFQCLIKDDQVEEKGELLACVFAPELRDSEGDIADLGVVKGMAYSHARNGGQLDIRHDGKPLTKEEAFVAENFLIQSGDPRFKGLKDNQGIEVDPTGGWGILIKIEKEDLRKKFRSGEWNGVSLFGDGLVEIEKSEVEDALQALLAKLGGDEGMTSEELKKALEESNKTLATSIVDGIVSALKKGEDKPEPKKDDPKPEPKTEPKKEELLYKGDPTDVKALKEHAVALQKQKLMEELDFTDPEKLLEHIAALEKGSNESEEPTEPKEEETPAQRVLRLEKENTALRKSTNQPPADGKGDDSKTSQLIASGLSKEDALLWERGTALGQAVNKRNGYPAN